jgi:hypothetical protein
VRRARSEAANTARRHNGEHTVQRMRYQIREVSEEERDQVDRSDRGSAASTLSVNETVQAAKSRFLGIRAAVGPVYEPRFKHKHDLRHSNVNMSPL